MIARHDLALQLWLIPEVPYQWGHWADVRQVAEKVGIDQVTLKRVANNVQAQIIDYDGERYVDFAVLEMSSSWRELLASARSGAGQLALF